MLLAVQNEEIKECKQPYTLLSPHTCDVTVEQTQRASHDASNMRTIVDEKFAQAQPQSAAAASNLPREQVSNFHGGAVQQQLSMGAGYES